MAGSKYDYIRRFEREPVLLPHCWPIVRIDGRNFTQFCIDHQFEKPNDAAGLNLMNRSAKAVMSTFRDIRIGFGQSDEFSFVLYKDSEGYMASCFTGNYVFHWKEYFPDKELKYSPVFDGRVVEYPTVDHVRDYLSWRQVDTHINNQYNTCFWTLVKSGKSQREAQSILKGTRKGEKNELLFRHGINYNDLPEQFKKGSVLFWGSNKEIAIEHMDIVKDGFWEDRPEILG